MKIVTVASSPFLLFHTAHVNIHEDKIQHNLQKHTFRVNEKKKRIRLHKQSTLTRQESKITLLR